MKRPPDARSRGVTLLEVLVSVFVLTVGVLGTFTMLERVDAAHRSLDFKRSVNDAYTRLAAEIRDAPCDYDGSNPAAFDPALIDPGLEGVVDLGWIGITTPVPPTSTIDYVGETGARLPLSVPRLRIEYRVRREAPPMWAPTAGPARPVAVAPAYDIDIRVRQVMNDPVRDEPGREWGWWIKIFPVKKTCNPRYEGTRRG